MVEDEDEVEVVSFTLPWCFFVLVVVWVVSDVAFPLLAVAVLVLVVSVVTFFPCFLDCVVVVVSEVDCAVS